MKRIIATLVLAAAALAAAACSDPLHDYGTCVRIETARCALREACDPAFDYATCAAYYEEFCRTREIDGPQGKDATDAEVDACAAAIAAFPCDLLDDAVDETDLIDECSFLWPKEDDDADAGADAPDAG